LKNTLVHYKHLQIGFPYEGNYGVLDRGGKAIEFFIFDHNLDGAFIPDYGGMCGHFGHGIYRARRRCIQVVRRGIDVARMIR